MKEVTKGVPPLVFAFRPESYKVMSSPEEITEWERLMKERVGFGASISNLSASCTECQSGGSSDDCDQD